MSPLVHGLLAWILAMLLISNINDRRIVVIMGVTLDIDGFFILFNDQLFQDYHHTLGHSYLFGIAIALFGAMLANDKKRVFVVGLGAFSLHLIADIIGSNWAIYPLYPLVGYKISIATYLSNEVIYNLINPIVFGISVIIVISFMYRQEKSPLEFVSEKLDRKVVGFYIFPFKYKCDICEKRAWTKCGKCGRKLCSDHMKGLINTKCTKCSNLTKRTNKV